MKILIIYFMIGTGFLTVCMMTASSIASGKINCSYISTKRTIVDGVEFIERVPVWKAVLFSLETVLFWPILLYKSIVMAKHTLKEEL